MLQKSPLHSLRKILPATILLIAGLPAHAVVNPVGGGILDAGLQGTWYSDTSFGTEAFVRRDLRLDFDWGSLRKPGGSLAWTKLGQLGADNYSVRWEGRIMARFSETYTLTALADSVRVWIKPEGTAWAAPLIDYWPASDPASYTPQSAAYAFTAGEAYEIRVEYRERGGPAMMRLLWSSPSTPEEVIQPTAMVGEIPFQRGVILADAVQSATNWGESYPWGSTDPRKDGVLELDTDGWPTEDFTFILRPTDRLLHQGDYLLTFEGSASVRIHVGGGDIFSADGSLSFGTQTAQDGSDGYDPVTNTTSLRVVISNTENTDFWPVFQYTRRSPSDPEGSGLRNVRMFRPDGIGSNTPHDEDELFAREAVATLETFVTFRWNDVNGTSDANGTSLGRWEDRRPWGPNTGNTSFTGENHEYKILLSNHTGRDLYIQVPHLADDDYILKLAQLIRYGADANGDPYTTVVADPHFPPLNPNLRVNIEYSNEIPWNTAGQYPQGNWARLQPEVRRQAGDPSWDILNFDNLIATVNTDGKAEGFTWGKRFTALRTVEISDIFRAVFGDTDMPAPGKADPRVRVLYMYQYDNNNSTATDAFNFIDGYFNKVDPLSTYTGDPKPVSYFIYGGGAATYYASADRLGILHDHPLTSSELGTFETPVLADGVADVSPAGSPWSFSGTAGIYRETQRFAGTYGTIPTPTSSVDAYTYRGMKITVGTEDVALYEVGRYIHPGNSGSATISVYAADNPNSAIFSRSFDLAGWPEGGTAWQRIGRNIFIISNKAYSAPIILQAGKSYYILSTEVNGGNVHSANVPFTPPPGVTIDGVARGSYNSGTGSWNDLVVEATADRTYGPVNFKIAPAPSVTDTGVTLGFLHDSRNPIEDNRNIDEHTFSPQAAFIAGNGSMEIDITFPAPGYYGLVYCLAQKQDQTPYDAATSATEFGNKLMVYLIEDGVPRSIAPSGQTDILPAVSGWTYESYWTKPFSGYDFFGSAPFEITDTAKTYRIRFEGTSTGTEDVVLLDNIQLASADKMTEGEIPSGGGFAEGAPDVSNWEARVMSMYTYAQSFGLRAMSYEGGWYPGGDANKMPLQFTSSFYAGAMVQGEQNAINALNRAGLVVNTDYTLGFALPDNGIADPESFSRIQAWRGLNATLPAEATNGQPLTSVFTADSAWLSLNTDGNTLQDGGWCAWNVIAPASGLYDFSLETTGSGSVSVRVNEHEVPVSGIAGGTLTSATPVFLTKGLHSIRILNQGGDSSLVALAITSDGQPAGFNGLAGAPGNEEVYLSWPSVAGATGYHVYYKSRLASNFTRATTLPVTGTQYTVSGLVNDNTFNFVVTYLDGSSTESAYSNQVTVVPAEIAALLAWEFDDNPKLSGATPPTLYSPIIAPGVSLVTGAWKDFDTNGYMIQDAAGFGGGWSLTEIPLRDDHYIGFSFTPEAGKTLHVTSMEFGFWWSRGTSAEAETLDCELRFSSDGFTTYQVVPLVPDPLTVGYSNGNTSAGVLLTADLAGVTALQALEAGTNAEFRIHFGGIDVNYWGIGKMGPDTDDLIVYGSVIPSDPFTAAYDSWAAGIAWDPSDDSTPGGVVNAAGVNNLLAFALNIDPKDPALPQFMPVVTTDPLHEDTLLLKTRQNIEAVGVLFALLTSSDLLLWDEYPVPPETIDPDFDGDGSTRLIQYSVPIPTNGDPVFLRLEVSIE